MDNKAIREEDRVIIVGGLCKGKKGVVKSKKSCITPMQYRILLDDNKYCYLGFNQIEKID